MTKSNNTNVAGLPLLGKNAIVTGAARGIGAAIAHKLASDGANVGSVAYPVSFPLPSPPPTPGRQKF